MSTDKDSGSLYSFDPFGTSGSQSRWGRKGAENLELPEIPGYEILDSLGSGGMGSVWTARYLPLHQLRAVKILSKRLADDAEFLKRFAQEAKALGRIEHPNIVKVFDANAEHRPPYIAMQWVEGESLSQILAKRIVPTSEAVRWFEQIGQALDYAHSLGFVHRDIKPSNVMITKEGKAMLIDFGVASALGQDPGANSLIIGTTRYLAPEVCEGKMFTHSSDIWALGVMIYRTLTGELPFNDTSDDAVRRKIVNEPPAIPKGVSPRVKKFLIRALEKDPARRHQSAGKLVQELRWMATPLLPKVKRDSKALFGSVAMFAAGAAIIAAILGAFAYSFFRAREQAPVVNIVHDNVDEPAQQGFGGPNIGRESSLVVPRAPGMKDLRGVWFVDLGTQWQDIVVQPTGGNAFHVSIEVRDMRGVATVSGQGELARDGKGVSYHEMTIDSNPSNVPYVVSSFAGMFSDDRSQVSGTHGTAGTPPIRLVRAADLTLTPYQNSEAGYSLSLAPGWTSADASTATEQITNFCAPGGSDIVLRVIVEPASGSSIETIFANREATLQSQGGYTKLSMNSSATFAGQSAVSWDFRQLVNGVSSHCLAFGVLRGDTSLTVESWIPTDREDIWAAVLERMRSKFQFSDY